MANPHSQTTFRKRFWHNSSGLKKYSKEEVGASYSDTQTFLYERLQYIGRREWDLHIIHSINAANTRVCVDLPKLVVFLRQIKVFTYPKRCLERGTGFLHCLCHLQGKGLFYAECFSSSPSCLPSSWPNRDPQRENSRFWKILAEQLKRFISLPNHFRYAIALREF